MDKLQEKLRRGNFDRHRTQEILARLLTTTATSRPDFHEPDEQFNDIRISGYHCDNAMGDEPLHNCGEYSVGFQKDHNGGYEWFNLADLIALARLAELNPTFQP